MPLSSKDSVSAHSRLSHPTTRLFRISFWHHKRPHVAEVGREITHWSENVGPVFAIIETTEVVLVRTALRGGLKGAPILVSPNETAQRHYFEDFPPALE
jgi:hypothetical protein